MSSQVVFKMAKYNPVVINKALELGKRIFHIDDFKTFQKRWKTTYSMIKTTKNKDNEWNKDKLTIYTCIFIGK